MGCFEPHFYNNFTRHKPQIFKLKVKKSGVNLRSLNK